MNPHGSYVAKNFATMTYEYIIHLIPGVQQNYNNFFTYNQKKIIYVCNRYSNLIKTFDSILL